MSRVPPTIALTAGDPCGVGPEVTLKALAAPPPRGARLLVIGNRRVFERTARRLRRRLPAWTAVRPDAAWPPGRALLFIDIPSARAFRPGASSGAAGAASLAYLDCAIRLWKAGRIRGLVTGPVTKWAAQRASPGFVGQTEYLAAALRAREVVMMFASERLRIALVTRHLPLGRVARALDAGLLRRTLRVTARALREHFRIPAPRLALCGLNPHAGEGAPGSEERTVMVPVLRALRGEGVRCAGPFAADGFFGGAAPAGYDAVVCAYHDQGLIPFKMAARDRGCQFSAGLPLIRTSPDHGSALDIAGQGKAQAGSMRYAIGLAARLARAGG